MVGLPARKVSTPSLVAWWMVASTALGASACSGAPDANSTSGAGGAGGSGGSTGGFGAGGGTTSSGGTSSGGTTSAGGTTGSGASAGGGVAGGGQGGSPFSCDPPSCGRSCAEIINDPLDGSTIGERSGGVFTAAGWQTTAWNNRIVYDLGAGIDCGYYEVSVTNFDPASQYVHRTAPWDCDVVDCYVHILGLYEADHGNHHQAADQCQSMVNLQATGLESGSFERHRRLKLKASSIGWAGDNSYTPKHTWDPAATYTLKVEWDPEHVALFINGEHEAQVELYWPGDPEYVPDPAQCDQPSECRMNLRFLFVGRDKNGAGGYLDGPVYSDVKVFDCSSS